MTEIQLTKLQLANYVCDELHKEMPFDLIFNESGCFDVRQNFGSGHFSQSLKATLSYLFGANQ